MAIPIQPTFDPAASQQTVCAANFDWGYAVYFIPNATSYTWALPAGWVLVSGQGSNIIYARPAPFGTSGNITVYASNTDGNSPVAVLPVTVTACGGSIPNPPVFDTSGFASDPLQFCTAPVVPLIQLQVYPDAAVTSYTWTPPAGWIVFSGQGTSIVQLQPPPFPLGAYLVSVIATNADGDSAPSILEIDFIDCTAPPAIPVVSGNNIVCAGQSFPEQYTTPGSAGATSYLWTVPSGWTIQSGQGTMAILALPGALAVSGNIAVSAINSAGQSQPGLFPVTVNQCTPLPNPFCDPIDLTTENLCTLQDHLNSWRAGLLVGGNFTCDVTNGGVLHLITCTTQYDIPLPIYTPDTITAVIRPYNALIVDVNPGLYTIGCTTYTLASQQQALISAGHPTLSRIDVITITAGGVVSVITGVPAVTPLPPLLPIGAHLVTYVYVRPQATSEGQISLTSLVAHVPNGTVNHSTLRWNGLVHQEDTFFQHDGNARAWFGDSTDPLFPSGAGTRLMFVSDLDAFRAGSINGTQWDVANIGIGSAALGRNNIASGLNSMAFGGNNASNIASGVASVAFGNGCVASFFESVAFGNFTTASGADAVAWGESTVASANLATAFGVGSLASGFRSLAFGNSTTASGDDAVAWGTGGIASGTNSTKWGQLNIASGIGATTWGVSNTASGDGTTVWGVSNMVSGLYSTASGLSNTVTGNYSAIFAAVSQTLAQDRTFLTETLRTRGGRQVNVLAGASGSLLLKITDSHVSYSGSGTITLPTLALPDMDGQKYWIVNNTAGATITIDAGASATTVNGAATFVWSPVNANQGIIIWYDSAEWKLLLTV